MLILPFDFLDKEYSDLKSEKANIKGFVLFFNKTNLNLTLNFFT